jgi:hypothetical protein
VAVAALVLATPGAAQGSRAARGAVIGGVIGGSVVGLLGAAIGQGVCDAADCSGAWVEVAVPAIVIGGIGGAMLGAGLGALFTDPEARTAAGRRRIRPAVLVELTAAQAESEYTVQTVGGGRVLVGARSGGLTVGPSIERLAGSGWRVTTVAIAARLAPATGAVRPFAEIDAGRFGWRHPGVIAACGPGSPLTCTFQDGTITDGYLGVAGAVGVALSDRQQRWSVYTQIRYHHSGSRPAAEPMSTVVRQLRQISVGVEVALGKL